MNTATNQVDWTATAVLIGRLIFALVFLVGVIFKLKDMDATAGYIAAAGFPIPKLLAWLAAVFEVALVACFLTGAYFPEARSWPLPMYCSSPLRFIRHRTGKETRWSSGSSSTISHLLRACFSQPRMGLSARWRCGGAFLGARGDCRNARHCRPTTKVHWRIRGDEWQCAQARRGGAPRRHTMERQTVQQVVDYLKTHPDIAKKALDFFKAHPDDVKGALSQVAKERGWDLSNIDTNALKAEIGKLS
jgi:uncharacterized membrane protein YphA (DoxX/SURF4 family)